MSNEIHEEPCVICGEIVPDYEPKYCCNAFDCSCRGLPIEPPICSNTCWDKLNEEAVDNEILFVPLQTEKD